MSEDPEKGHPDAHTHDGAPLPGADPADLLAGSPDLDVQDVLALAAELSSTPRRARGRPQGAANRKNNDMIAYLQARGHRDPWETLSLIQTADTLQLANAMRSPLMKNGKQLVSKAGTPLFNTPSPMDVLALQMRAADALMPYHHSKKPQQLELPVGDNRRPFMVIGEMNVQLMSESGLMSAGMPVTKTIDNQPLSETPTVRQTDTMPHE